jgi:hypothetical protein
MTKASFSGLVFGLLLLRSRRVGQSLGRSRIHTDIFKIIGSAITFSLSVGQKMRAPWPASGRRLRHMVAFTPAARDESLSAQPIRTDRTQLLKIITRPSTHESSEELNDRP